MEPIPAKIESQYASRLPIEPPRTSRVTLTFTKPAALNSISSCFASAKANDAMNMLRFSGRRRAIASAKKPHIGARSGLEITHTDALPPGRRTRRNSERPCAGFGKNWRPSWQITASKLPFRKGSSSPSAAIGRKRVSFTRWIALRTISGDMSAPTTTPEAPITGRMPTEASPVPVDIPAHCFRIGPVPPQSHWAQKVVTTDPRSNRMLRSSRPLQFSRAGQAQIVSLPVLPL